MTYLHQDQNQMSTREREKRITDNINLVQSFIGFYSCQDHKAQV